MGVINISRGCSLIGLLVFSCLLMSSTLMTDFAQSDALLKRFPPGLYVDKIEIIDYLDGAQSIKDLPEGQNAQFIALMQAQRAVVPQGALLIVHDVGQNANWP